MARCGCFQEGSDVVSLLGDNYVDSEAFSSEERSQKSVRFRLGEGDKLSSRCLVSLCSLVDTVPLPSLKKEFIDIITRRAVCEVVVDRAKEACKVWEAALPEIEPAGAFNNVFAGEISPL